MLAEQLSMGPSAWQRALRLWAAALMGGPVALFKDKINFKMPGGAGFQPHQDQQAGWSQYAIREAVNNLLPLAQVGGEVVALRLLRQRGVKSSNAIAVLIPANGVSIRTMRFI